MKLIAAILLPVTIFAADPTAVTVYKANDLKAFEQKLKPKIDKQKVATEQLERWDNHATSVSHREGDGEAEVHETMSDFFFVQTGEATLVTGGKVLTPRTSAPNEIRGPKIEGGEKHKIAAGDVVHIPVKVPHQLLIENGKQFTYFVIKVAK